MSTFQVDPQALYTHANDLDDAGTAVASATAASALSTEAFGVMCAFLPPIISVCLGDLDSTITNVGTMTTKLAESIRAAGAEYELADVETSLRFDSLGEGLRG